MDQRNIELNSMRLDEPIYLLHRESVLTIGGQAESTESSDPDTEDYFAASENSDYDPNPFSDRNAMRMDSKTPDLPIANLARSVLIKSHAALLQPPSIKTADKQATHVQRAHHPGPSAPQQQVHIHPALRTVQSVSNAAGSIFDYENQTRHPNFVPPYVPNREIPVYASPQLHPRVVPPIQPHNEQPRHSFSSMFQFGRSDTYNFEITTENAVRSRSVRKRSRDKIDQLGQKLTNFKLAGKVKQVVGLKRSRQDSPTNDTDAEPLLKIAKSNADTPIHCQTCQCHAAVSNSVAEHRNKCSRQPPPPPPRPGFIRRTTTFSVTETPLTSGSMSPRDGRNESNVTTYYGFSQFSGSNSTQYPSSDPAHFSGSDSASSRSTPYHNDETLAILEGRSDRLWHEAPADLVRDDPASPLTHEDSAKLRAAIADNNELRKRLERQPRENLAVQSPFSNTFASI